MNPPAPIVVAAMYHFATLDDYQAMRQPLLDTLQQHDIKGTLLLAHEGINGTVAGSRESIDTLLAQLRADPRLAGLGCKESYTEQQPFLRSKVKLKREIVTMGQPNIDPRHIVGSYVKPSDWNALISDPEVTVIDTRNAYEVEIGSFDGAINPDTTTFREFPDYAETHLDPARHKKVAMFCTGGIRCEKSTAFLKGKGFEEVYHLEGGILKYLEQVPQEQSLWRGECFVFDDRVSVNHQLQRGSYEQCNACRMPITAEDMRSEHFQQGVSCPHCHDKTSAEQRKRFADREKQVQLARTRGQRHLGDNISEDHARQREAKHQHKAQQRQGK